MNIGKVQSSLIVYYSLQIHASTPASSRAPEPKLISPWPLATPPSLCIRRRASVSARNAPTRLRHPRCIFTLSPLKRRPLDPEGQLSRSFPWCWARRRIGAHSTRRRMSQIWKANTRPEVLVRKQVYHLGYRYRLHRRDLPGTPDLVFPGRRKVIFVHGCFWHRHDCGLAGNVPKTRSEYWEPKLRRNIERDRKARCDLERQGWRVLTLWECELGDLERISTVLRGFLGSS